MVAVVVFARSCDSVCNKTLTHARSCGSVWKKPSKNRWKDFRSKTSAKKKKLDPVATLTNCYAEEDYLKIARNFTEPTQLAMLHNLGMFVYACACVHMCTCAHACIAHRMRTDSDAHTCLRVRVRPSVHARARARACACVHACVFVCALLSVLS